MINQYISLVLLVYFASYCLAVIESQCMPNRIANPSWLTTGVELAENPSFEDGRSPWVSGDEEGWDRIYASDALFGACGLWYAKIDSCPSRSGCTRPNAAVIQTIQVNQSQSKPIVVSVHTTGTNINGSYGNDYSVYADVQHFDGTSTYGYYAPFFLGVTLWQFNSFIIQNPKPIKSLIVYGIFRNFVGTVYFDEFSVQEATVASANLIANPSFDGGNNNNNCTAPIYGWSNINPNSPYITCPEPPAYIINSPPGFIGTPGANGLSGAEQRVFLRQTQPLKITFRVYARWSRTTVSGPYVVVHDARLLINYTDGTQDTAAVEITDTTQVRVYTITFNPTKTVSFVDVQLRFDGGGYEGTIIHWDDASLVQGG